jgi:hypothetical protein
MMKGRMSRTLPLLLAALPLVAGCTVKERAEALWEQTAPAVLEQVPFMHKESKPTGITYPATVSVQTIFDPEQVPAECTVFAHLLVSTPADINGKSIAQAVEQEAMRYGANLLLIGRSRQAKKEEEQMSFVYYGPDQSYNCKDRWCGWKFGYEDWVNQGSWATVGYEEWNKNEAWFSTSLVIQAAFLRCQHNP